MAKADKPALVRALDHALIASSGTANFAPYCRFEPGWVVGYDGLIAAGAATSEHVDRLAPNTEMFRHAITRAGEPHSVTVMGDGSIVVRGNKVRAIVQCFPLQHIPNVLPDVPLIAMPGTVADSIIAVSKITAVKSESIVGSSVLLRNKTAIATDGGTIVESFHGAELPGRWLLPTEFANALAKVKRVPTHCGWSAETFTVWFDNDAWLRTNLYNNQYPDTDVYFAQLISQCSEYRPVPVEMLQAIETLKPFRESDRFTIAPYGLNTRADLQGASFAFEHWLTYAGEYPTEGLRMMATHGEHAAFCPQGCYWYGKTVRGITALG